MTHALCHVSPAFNPSSTVQLLTTSQMYGRATKAVSVCPPAYYADRAADRARIFLAGWFDDQPNMTPQQRRARQERLAAMNPAQRAQAEVAEAAQRQAARTAQNAAMNVHPDLADTMFYV